MNKVLNFKVIITQDEDSVFVATCPAIPSCHTQGATYEKAIENIEEAIRLCLKVAKDDTEYRSLSVEVSCEQYLLISNLHRQNFKNC